MHIAPLAGRVLVIVSLAAAVGCQGQQASSEGGNDAAPTFMPDATIKELMLSIVDPSADIVWLAVKSETTKGGVVDTVPQNDEEWLRVRHGAVMLAEAANLLMIPGRHVAPPGEKSETPGVELEPAEMERMINADRATWNSRAKALHEATLATLKAIDAKNAEQVFELGAKIDEACENCHTHYWYPNEKIPEFPSSTPTQ